MITVLYLCQFCSLFTTFVQFSVQLSRWLKSAPKLLLRGNVDSRTFFLLPVSLRLSSGYWLPLIVRGLGTWSV
jgi:hypothetical protein